MILSGWDLSSRKTAVVWVDTDELVMRYTTMEWRKDLDHGERALNAWKAVIKFHGDQVTPHDHVAYLEAPFVHHKRPSSVLPLAYVSGATQASLLMTGADVTLVAVSRWKKEVIGNGNASKTMVAEWFESEFPEAEGIIGDQDLTDAACVLLYGAAMEE